MPYHYMCSVMLCHKLDVQRHFLTWQTESGVST